MRKKELLNKIVELQEKLNKLNETTCKNNDKLEKAITMIKFNSIDLSKLKNKKLKDEFLNTEISTDVIIVSMKYDVRSINGKINCNIDNKINFGIIKNILKEPKKYDIRLLEIIYDKYEEYLQKQRDLDLYKENK